MQYKESQTNYVARALEEGVDLAYDMYRLKRMKEKLLDSTPNKNLAKTDPIASKIVSEPNKAVTAKELVNTFLGENK